jgi:hypothetical protein
MQEIIFNFQPYISIFISLVAVVLAYLLGSRSKKFEHLFILAQDSMKDVFSPMYIEINKILRASGVEERDTLIENLYTNFLNKTVYKLGDEHTLDLFFESEEAYYIYKKQRDDESWEYFWKLFHFLSSCLKSNFWECYRVLYRDFRWMLLLSRKNIFTRISFELLSMFYEMFKSLTVLTTILLLFSIYDQVYAHRIPEDYKLLLLYIWLLLIIVFAILVMINASTGYLTSMSMNRKKSHLLKILQKRFPKIYKLYDDLLGDQIIIKNITVPERKKLIIDKNANNRYNKELHTKL